MVLRGRDPFRDEWTLPMTSRKRATIPLGQFQCGEPPEFPQMTPYKRTFPGSGASLVLTAKLHSQML